MSLPSERRSALLSIGVVALAAGWELWMREAVHRVGDQWLRLLLLGVAAAVLLAAQGMVSRLEGLRGGALIRRWPLPVIVAIYLMWVVGTTAGSVSGLIWQGVPWATLALGLWAAARLSAQAWSSLRRAVVIAAVLFVGAQPLLVALRAPERIWPEPVKSAKSAVGALTVYVLFDEWNGNAAQPMMDALSRAGLATNLRRVRSIGDGTSKVIPALFTGEPFDKAKPCSPTAVCSGDHVLDFGRIAASRPDLDIVGFFHPYCAIRGLRWCYRGTVASDADSLDRWRCALRRRTGWSLLSPSSDYCDRIFRAPWNAMVERTLAAAWKAPAWQQGGVLFLHLPLPHPPGFLPRAGLTDNYADNLRRASQALERMAHLALARPRPVTFVVFSDHPLRQSQWCLEQWIFSDLHCRIAPELADVDVPLLVAGNGPLPDISKEKSHLNVFRLPAAVTGPQR